MAEGRPQELLSHIEAMAQVIALIGDDSLDVAKMAGVLIVTAGKHLKL